MERGMSRQEDFEKQAGPPAAEDLTSVPNAQPQNSRSEEQKTARSHPKPDVHQRSNSLQQVRQLKIVLIGIFVLALLPRLLYIAQIQTPPFSDMQDYDRIAVRFLMGEGLIQSEDYKAYRAPLYPLFLAFNYLVFGHNVFWVRVVQALLGSLTAVLASFWAFKTRAATGLSVAFATITGICVALSDESVFYCGQLLTETLYAVLLMGWLVTLTCSRSKRFRNLILPGLLQGAMVLTRPVALFLIPVGWFWIVRKADEKGPRPKLERIFVYTLIALAVIVPWTVRNAIVTGHFVPVSTNGGVNFYIGHNEGFGYWSTGAKSIIREQTDLDEVEESKFFFALGPRYIKQEPFQDLVHSIKKIGYLYTTTYKPWPWFNHGRELKFAGNLKLPTWNWGWPVIAIIVLGTSVAVITGKDYRLLYLVVLVHTVACIVFFARARFRLPLIPMFSLLIAEVVIGACEVIKRFLEARRCVPPGE